NEPIDYDLSSRDPAGWSGEHVIPLSQGGRDTYENIVGTHLLCNQARGTKPMVQGMFTGMRPKPSEFGTRYVKEGSRADTRPWRARNRPVDGHTVHQETRCSQCPCYRSRW